MLRHVNLYNKQVNRAIINSLTQPESDSRRQYVKVGRWRHSRLPFIRRIYLMPYWSTLLIYHSGSVYQEFQRAVVIVPVLLNILQRFIRNSIFTFNPHKPSSSTAMRHFRRLHKFISCRSRIYNRTYIVLLHVSN